VEAKTAERPVHAADVAPTAKADTSSEAEEPRRGGPQEEDEHEHAQKGEEAATQNTEEATKQPEEEDTCNIDEEAKAVEETSAQLGDHASEHRRTADDVAMEEAGREEQQEASTAAEDNEEGRTEAQKEAEERPRSRPYFEAQAHKEAEEVPGSMPDVEAQAQEDAEEGPESRPDVEAKAQKGAEEVPGSMPDVEAQAQKEAEEVPGSMPDVEAQAKEEAEEGPGSRPDVAAHVQKEAEEGPGSRPDVEAQAQKKAEEGPGSRPDVEAPEIVADAELQQARGVAQAETWQTVVERRQEATEEAPDAREPRQAEQDEGKEETQEEAQEEGPRGMLKEAAVEDMSPGTGEATGRAPIEEARESLQERPIQSEDHEDSKQGQPSDDASRDQVAKETSQLEQVEVRLKEEHTAQKAQMEPKRGEEEEGDQAKAAGKSPLCEQEQERTPQRQEEEAKEQGMQEAEAQGQPTAPAVVHDLAKAAPPLVPSDVVVQAKVAGNAGGAVEDSESEYETDSEPDIFNKANPELGLRATKKPELERAAADPWTAFFVWLLEVVNYRAATDSGAPVAKLLSTLVSPERQSADLRIQDLTDGKLLCALLVALKPDCLTQVLPMPLGRVAQFQQACKKIGVRPFDVLTPPDLLPEDPDINDAPPRPDVVLRSIIAIGGVVRTWKDWSGPAVPSALCQGKGAAKGRGNVVSRFPR